MFRRHHPNERIALARDDTEHPLQDLKEQRIVALRMCLHAASNHG